MKSRFLIAIPALVVLAVLAAGFVFWTKRHPQKKVVFAALTSSGGFNAAASLQDTNGGMAQYGAAIQQATSLSADLNGTLSWNTFIASRSGWSMSSTICSRLANADWNARQVGPPAITAQQLANAANHLINSVLGTMSASQQMSLFLQNVSEVTPKGRWGLNPDYPYVSATQNSDGRWTVTVSSDAFAQRKADFQLLAPAMVSASTNFYPAEATLVTYSVATWDMGFGNNWVSRMKTAIGDVTGLDMTNQCLFGDSGHAIRRPLSTFLTDQTLGQFFAELGF